MYDCSIQNRAVEFLNQSNAIEGINSIDYSKPNYQNLIDGHYNAFITSQEFAKNRTPLTIKRIKELQAMITREQRTVGVEIDDEAIGHIRNPQTLQKNVRIGSHVPPSYVEVPTKLDYLIERINEALKKIDFNDEVAYCDLVGWAFHEFESIHPFVDGNGRVGRLIANYIATYCNKPIIVFNSEYSECNSYYEAHLSPSAMKVFMSKKMKEAIFGKEGNLKLATKIIDESRIEYALPDAREKECIDWNRLNKAAKVNFCSKLNTQSDMIRKRLLLDEKKNFKKIRK